MDTRSERNGRKPAGAHPHQPQDMALIRVGLSAGVTSQRKWAPGVARTAQCSQAELFPFAEQQQPPLSSAPARPSLQAGCPSWGNKGGSRADPRRSWKFSDQSSPRKIMKDVISEAGGGDLKINHLIKKCRAGRCEFGNIL